MPVDRDHALIAVDIGNSRMKLGRFERAGDAPKPNRAVGLPQPTDTFDIPITSRAGDFDPVRLAAWCNEHLTGDATWLIGSVHRGAADRLAAAIAEWAARSNFRCDVRRLTYRDVPLEIRVDEPARVGIDRLFGALAADRLREPRRPAIVVDLGTAITVDLLEPSGAFAGGAILPGIAMSTRALAEQTDALPNIGLQHLDQPPRVPGKSTTSAIEAGLFWGAVGAIRELVVQFSTNLTTQPELFLTGGASRHVAELLADDARREVHHVPHLVLSGIALVAEQTPGEAGG